MPVRSLVVPLTAVVAEAVVVIVLTGWSLRGVVLAGVATALVYAAAAALSGPVAAAISAGFWVLAPAVLGFWRADFRPDWHHRLLPVLYGAHDSPRLLAGIALLLAVVVQVRLGRPVGWVAAALLVVAAGALVRVDEATWSFHWSGLQTSLDHVREFGWSRRIVEYLPLAGAVAVLTRRGWTALPLVALFAGGVVLPLAHDHGNLLRDARSVVPGLPLYAILAGSIVLLVPARSRRTTAAPVTPAR